MCTRTGQRILSGEISPVPFKLKSEEGCTYCKYHEICGFDPRIPGYHKNELAELGDAEVWGKLTEEYGKDKADRG